MAAAMWASLIVVHWPLLPLGFSAYHLAYSIRASARRALPGIAAVSADVGISESLRERGVDPFQFVFTVR